MLVAAVCDCYFLIVAMLLLLMATVIGCLWLLLSGIACAADIGCSYWLLCCIYLLLLAVVCCSYLLLPAAAACS